MRERFNQQIMCEELLKSFEEEDMALLVEKACSTSKKKRTLVGGVVLFTATVECLTMAMRWCYVLTANVGFMVSAKWVIFIAPSGGTNRVKMHLKSSKRRNLKGKRTKTKCSNYGVSQQITQ